MPQQSKAALIRSYLRKEPDAKPSELAERMMREHRGRTVRPSEIYDVRRRMREQGSEMPAHQEVPAPDDFEEEPEAAAETPSSSAETQKQPEPTPTPQPGARPSLAEQMRRLKEAAEAVEGIEEAKRILDLLG